MDTITFISAMRGHMRNKRSHHQDYVEFLQEIGWISVKDGALVLNESAVSEPEPLLLEKLKQLDGKPELSMESLISWLMANKKRLALFHRAYVNDTEYKNYNKLKHWKNFREEFEKDFEVSWQDLEDQEQILRTLQDSYSAIKNSGAVYDSYLDSII